MPPSQVCRVGLEPRRAVRPQELQPADLFVYDEPHLCADDVWRSRVRLAGRYAVSQLAGKHEATVVLQDEHAGSAVHEPAGGPAARSQAVCRQAQGDVAGLQYGGPE